jgi:hypothetical protein
MNEKKCHIRATRKAGQPTQDFIFTMEDAMKAGLASNDTYKKYPVDMLRWRAVARMARTLFADALAYCYLLDEIEYIPPTNAEKLEGEKPIQAPAPVLDAKIETTPEPPIDPGKDQADEPKKEKSQNVSSETKWNVYAQIEKSMESATTFKDLNAFLKAKDEAAKEGKLDPPQVDLLEKKYQDCAKALKANR